jgi:hypothetical protein
VLEILSLCCWRQADPGRTGLELTLAATELLAPSTSRPPPHQLLRFVPLCAGPPNPAAAMAPSHHATSFRRPTSPKHPRHHEAARDLRPSTSVLEVRVAAHLAHGGVTAGCAMTAPHVCAAVPESALRRAGSATPCAPVPPCGGPRSGWFGRFCS